MQRTRSSSPSRRRASRSRSPAGGAPKKKVVAPRKPKKVVAATTDSVVEAQPSKHPLEHVQWTVLREAHPGKEIEIRPFLGDPEGLSWDRTRNIIQELMRRGDLERTETWMLRVTARVPRTTVEGAPPTFPPTPRLTIEIPAPRVTEWLSAWTSKAALQNWIRLHPQHVRMDIKETVLRQEDVDWPLRISVARETSEHPSSFPWQQMDRVRFLRRVSFRHTSNTYRMDLSMVRSAPAATAFPLKNLPVSSVLHGEAEVEILDQAPATEDLRSMLSHDLRMFLETLTQTPGMVPRTEAKEVLLEYLDHVSPLLVPAELRDTPAQAFAAALEQKTRNNTRQWFVGYDVTGLQLEHLIEPDRTRPPTKPRLLDERTPMMMTEKADGERHLLLTMKDGRVYLINNRLQVTAPPLEATETARSCILDGEYLTEGGRKLFLAFDCLFDGGQDVRKEAFLFAEKGAKAGRSVRMERIIQGLRPTDDAERVARVQAKKFLGAKTPEELLSMAHKTWTMRKSKFNYEIDGLIFVAVDRPYLHLTPGQDRAMLRDPWVLKWKPAHLLTIDFLVMNPRPVPLLSGAHGVTMTEVELYTGSRMGSNYVATPFAPTPRTLFEGMKTRGTNPEPIMDPCIVECQYDPAAPVGQRWIPLRVRHDKTQQHLSNQRRYGSAAKGGLISGMGANNERVADDVWKSIQSGVLGREDLFLVVKTAELQEEVRRKLEEDSQPEGGEDARYYAVQEKTKEDRDRSIIIALRKFHNRVKHNLIMAASQLVRPLASVRDGVPTIRAFDLGAGRGGDLEKYQTAGVKHLAALEYSAPELEELNQRYHQLERRVKAQGSQVFRLQRFHGDMRHRLSTGEAGLAVQNTQSKTELFNFFEKSEFSIHMAASMFAMHYAFDTERSRWTLMQNVYDILQLEGIFVGISFDGDRILKELEKTGERTFEKNGQVFARIRKAYEGSSLRPYGQAIDFQFQTITEGDDDLRREYLVDFAALEKDFDRVYQIRKISDEQAHEFGLPGACGPLSDFVEHGFEDLSPEEQAFSQLYRYFVYQKQGPGNMLEISKVQKILAKE